MSRTVVVSNRVPLPNGTDAAADAAQAGGLTVVLRELLEKRGGLWFGWSGHVSTTPGPAAVAPRGRIRYATIDLTPAEHEGYYNGFSNGVLWPVMHAMPGLVRFKREDADTYRQVNERMADALLPLLRPDDAIWVQDYHLFWLPQALRARGVRNPIGFFLHIPFPAADMIGLVPGLDKLVRAVMAADLVGFQTRHDAANFTTAACDLAQARALSPGLLRSGGGTVRVGVFPVEIEPLQFAALAARASASAASVRLQTSLVGQNLVLGVDRLDPSKGLPQRLEAFGRLLERTPEWRGRVSLLQIAAVSRSDVAAYRDLRRQLEGIAGRINGEYGEPHWVPIRLVTKAIGRDAVAGYMRRARVALVTPLRDGMNVVAKEYVAAQDPDDPGVLVLSRFAGAADQLTDALVVNPNDPDAITEALDTALRMDADARRARWSRMWSAIEGRSARAWGADYLAALEDATAGEAARRHTAALLRPGTEPGTLAPGALALRLSPPAMGIGGSLREGGLYPTRRTH